MDNQNEENAGATGTVTPDAGSTATPKSKPAAAKPAAAKPTKAKEPKAKTAKPGDNGQNDQGKNSGQGSEETPAKELSEAAAIAEKLGVSELWENDKGEYFTSENPAQNSVGGKRDLVKKHSF